MRGFLKFNHFCLHWLVLYLWSATCKVLIHRHFIVIFVRYNRFSFHSRHLVFVSYMADRMDRISLCSRLRNCNKTISFPHECVIC